MNLTTHETITEDALDELPQSQANEPSWLAEARRESQTTYNSLELPPRTAHLWRYTDPALFQFINEGSKDGVGQSTPDSVAETEAKKQLADGSLSAIATSDGEANFEIQIGATSGADKLVVLRLSEAVNKYPELIQRYLGTVIDRKFGKFEALNSALWSDGLFVYAPKGAIIPEPVHLLRRGSATERWNYGRTLVIADEGAELTVMDEYHSTNDTVAGKTNHVVEVFGEANSHIHYFALQRNNLKSLSYYTQRAAIGESAKITSVFATLGGRQHKADLGTILNGRGGESLQYGLVFGSGKQQLDHHTVHINRGANGYSNLDFKVVLKDRAHSAYTGLIRVDENVQNCEAYQSNRNLLLNRGARAESIPELEILCDEVICTHGATVGQIDEMQVFYLMNRGIPRNETVKMIVRGHVEPTLKILPDSLRERIRNHVDQRLETL